MSWLDDEQVERLREVYNKEHPKEKPIPKGKTHAVWDKLQKRLASKCKTGRAECIVSSLMSRPKAPAEWALNRYEWLSSDDIQEIQEEYMKLFPNYFFVGSVPIDFDLQNETRECLVSVLCSMKLPELYKQGYERVGIIFNTDPHDGPGQHWIALFADIRPELQHGRITYFDSYAQKPEPEIKKLMRRWKDQWDATGVHPQALRLSYNRTRHQYKDSECGMYCLYFHYACLTELPMNQQIPDEVINSFRNLLFRMPKIES